jgi:hypothetical protein
MDVVGGGEHLKYLASTTIRLKGKKTIRKEKLETIEFVISVDKVIKKIMNNE